MSPHTPPASPAARRARSAPIHRALARALAATRAVLCAIAGVPDYERYVAHVRSCHPDRTPMTRDEFARERLAARYDRPGARCC